MKGYEDDYSREKEINKKKNKPEWYLFNGFLSEFQISGPDNSFFSGTVCARSSLTY